MSHHAEHISIASVNQRVSAREDGAVGWVRTPSFQLPSPTTDRPTEAMDMRCVCRALRGERGEGGNLIALERTHASWSAATATQSAAPADSAGRMTAYRPLERYCASGWVA